MSFEVDRDAAVALLTETGVSKAAKNLNDVKLIAKLTTLGDKLDELEDVEVEDKAASKLLKAIRKDSSILEDLEIVGDAETNGHAKKKKSKKEEVAEDESEEEDDEEEDAAEDEEGDEDESEEEEDSAEESEEEEEEKPAKKASKKGKKGTKVKNKKTTKKASKRQGMSCMDAAAKVLADSKKPMRAQEMIDKMASKGLWTSPGGATPAATLYSSIIREIDKKGKESRFRKVDKGQFAAPGVKTKN